MAPPEEWGPHFWYVLHTLCLSGRATPDLVYAFSDMIPCQSCNDHFKMVLIQMPFNPEKPFEWSVNAHNAVNKRLEKPLFTPQQALDVMENKKKFDYKIYLFLALVLLIVFFFIKNNGQGVQERPSS